MFVTEFGGLAQLGEHLPCKQGVTSSSLVISIEFMKRDFQEFNIIEKKQFNSMKIKYIDNYT